MNVESFQRTNIEKPIKPSLQELERLHPGISKRDLEVLYDEQMGIYAGQIRAFQEAKRAQDMLNNDNKDLLDCVLAEVKTYTSADEARLEVNRLFGDIKSRAVKSIDQVKNNLIESMDNNSEDRELYAKIIIPQVEKTIVQHSENIKGFWSNVADFLKKTWDDLKNAAYELAKYAVEKAHEYFERKIDDACAKIHKFFSDLF